MSIRGQSADAWRGRWRQGTCPIHGKGFVDDLDAAAAPTIAGAPGGGVAVRCPDPGCVVRATQWAGKDALHAFFGMSAAPDELRTALAQSGDIDHQTSARPGAHARAVRVGWPTGEE
jgi:hypothetical protein